MTAKRTAMKRSGRRFSKITPFLNGKLVSGRIMAFVLGPMWHMPLVRVSRMAVAAFKVVASAIRFHFVGFINRAACGRSIE
jgi:hypothetical protein